MAVTQSKLQPQLQPQLHSGHLARNTKPARLSMKYTFPMTATPILSHTGQWSEAIYAAAAARPAQDRYSVTRMSQSHGIPQKNGCIQWSRLTNAFPQGKPNASNQCSSHLSYVSIQLHLRICCAIECSARGPYQHVPCCKLSFHTHKCLRKGLACIHCHC